jgi:phosphoribosylglycinamide formyltransferase-1
LAVSIFLDAILKMIKLPIVILISGNGSNLQAIMDKCLHLVDIKAVISDNPNAYGLIRARKANIRNIVYQQHEGESREEYCNVLTHIVKSFNPELVVLAGFMRVLTSTFIKEFPRTLNIHPSILPKFKGLHTHKRVLESGDKEHGITIHWVTKDLDSGPIIIQQSFSVQENDTEKTLETKVHELEHVWYPWIINEIAVGMI